MIGVIHAVVLAALGTPNEWPYVAAAYLAVFVGIGAFTLRTVILSRRVGSKLPPEKRRWM